MPQLQETLLEPRLVAFPQENIPRRPVEEDIHVRLQVLRKTVQAEELARLPRAAPVRLGSPGPLRNLRQDLLQRTRPQITHASAHRSKEIYL